MRCAKLLPDKVSISALFPVPLGQKFAANDLLAGEQYDSKAGFLLCHFGADGSMSGRDASKNNGVSRNFTPFPAFSEEGGENLHTQRLLFKPERSGGTSYVQKRTGIGILLMPISLKFSLHESTRIVIIMGQRGARVHTQTISSALLEL